MDQAETRVKSGETHYLSDVARKESQIFHTPEVGFGQFDEESRIGSGGFPGWEDYAA